MAIPVQDASQLFTDALVNIFIQNIGPTSFLRSFFNQKFHKSFSIRINVKRGSEFIAVDVNRHSDGNLNITSTIDQKKFVPPYYDEYIVMNNHELYQNAVTLISQSTGGDAAQTAAVISATLEEMAMDMVELRNKIERAVELMCAQIFTTGVVQLKNDTSIDYKRKASSKVDLGAAAYWDVATVDPTRSLEAGCEFIRKEALNGAAVFDAIMRGSTWNALKNNPIVQKQLDIRKFDFGTLTGPRRNATGANAHGIISCGAYDVRLWTYDQFYTDPADGVKKSYIPDGDVVLLPENPTLDLAYCLVPQLISKDGSSIPQTSEMWIHDHRDEKAQAEEVHIKACPLPVPTDVDSIYTFRAIPTS